MRQGATPEHAHVLVARLDNAGDVLLTGPAVRAVAASSRRVIYLCGAQGRAAAEMLPGVDEIIEFDAPWVSYAPPPVTRSGVETLVERLEATGIDRAFILTSFHQSALPLALLLRMAGVPTIAAECEDYPGSLLDVRHRSQPGLHEVERSLSLVEALGYRLPTGDHGRLTVRLPLPDRRAFPAPYVVVHPGASVPARGLEPCSPADIVDGLARGGWSVAVTGTAAERNLTAAVAGRRRKTVVDLGGQLDFAGLAGVLAGAEVVVCGNTGPAHLAAAVGTPVVSLFAPVVPVASWRPWGVPGVVLGDQAIGCAGCRARVCPLPRQACIAGVQPGDVVEAVRSLADRAADDQILAVAR